MDDHSENFNEELANIKKNQSGHMWKNEIPTFSNTRYKNKLKIEKT